MSTRLVIGAAAAWVALIALMMRDRKRASSPSTEGWTLVEGERVTLEQDARYRACIRVPFLIPTSLIRSELAPRMTERGFSMIEVYSARPAGWADVECDLFVEATWSQPNEAFDRPGSVPFGWVKR